MLSKEKELRMRQDFEKVQKTYPEIAEMKIRMDIFSPKPSVKENVVNDDRLVKRSNYTKVCNLNLNLGEMMSLLGGDPNKMKESMNFTNRCQKALGKNLAGSVVCATDFDGTKKKECLKISYSLDSLKKF